MRLAQANFEVGAKRKVMPGCSRDFVTRAKEQDTAGHASIEVEISRRKRSNENVSVGCKFWRTKHAGVRGDEIGVGGR